MNKFAIIQFGPFQYKVEEGKEYTVPNFEAEEGKKMNVEAVKAVGDENSMKAGKSLAKASVEIEILKQGKGEKVRSAIFKAKSRYRKTRGFRKSVTTFKVSKITL